MLSMRKCLLCALGAGVILAIAGLHSVRQTATEAREEERHAGEVAFRRLTPGSGGSSGVETIGSPARFTDIAVYGDRFYLSGPAGLFAYDRSGILQARYLPGADLPSAPPGALAVTPDRLLIATNGEGLLLFDGSHFEQIRPEPREARQITAVLPLGTGHTLLGTPQGLFRFDGRTLKPRLVKQHITALAGAEGDLWIGTLDAGVFHEHAGQLDHLLAELPDPRVLSLFVRDTTALVGTPLGVAEFLGGRKVRSVADGYFARAVYAGTRGVSTGTQDEGITGALASSLPGAIQRIVEIGNTVFALTDAGLYEHTAGTWRQVIRTTPGLLTDHNVSALHATPGGKVWVGYFDRGLDIADVGAGRVKHLEDDHLFCVNRIVSNGSRTAVATANGLVMFDSDETPRQVLTRKTGLLADHVTDFAFRGADGFVAATPAGLTFADAAGLRSLYALHGLVNNHVYTVAADGPTIAAGTLGGLSLLEGDRVRANYTTANSHLKHNWITALTRSGKDWYAGTYGSGVWRLDESGDWRRSPDLAAADNLVINPNAMLATPNHLFAGTLDRGLLILDRASDRWRAFSTGLPSLNVTALAAADGFVYLGTDNGVVRLAETRLD